ncbi:NAD(P)-dependent oxidoreductase, partial [Bilophila wadsworthia]|uniref:NAD(P)-dependent oxidoreductase n=1 Tax=Bilophila wadsworthia TaxID=35833 RepID=UPI002670A330
KAAKVAGWGAEAFATPQEAARGAGVVMSCLSSVAALKAVAGGEDGVFSCMGEGMAFYDMGTWDIESVLALDAEAERHGVRYVHMPMGKGPEAAEAGESPLLFGGSKDVYERDKAFLSDIGEVFYLGDVKAACAFKLITNLIGLSNNVILTEGVFLAKRMGLSEEAFLNGAKSTGAWSYQMRNSGHKVFAEAFLPMRGTLDNAWKDMKFGVEMAEEAGVSCPAFAMLRDRYKAASEAGYGEEDYISVYRLLMDAENDGATAAEPCN